MTTAIVIGSALMALIGGAGLLSRHARAVTVAPLAVVFATYAAVFALAGFWAAWVRNQPETAVIAIIGTVGSLTVARTTWRRP
jgi:hypothetical protein